MIKCPQPTWLVPSEYSYTVTEKISPTENQIRPNLKKLSTSVFYYFQFTQCFPLICSVCHWILSIRQGIYFFLSGDPCSQSQKEIFIFTAAMCYAENIINFITITSCSSYMAIWQSTVLCYCLRKTLKFQKAQRKNKCC